MAHILAIGIATLDIVNTLDGYPAEDDVVRALRQRVSRGGNATNNGSRTIVHYRGLPLGALRETESAHG